MKIHVILLAAGNSRRFGGIKLLHYYKGKPMYRHTLEMLHETDSLWGEKILVSQYDEIIKAGISYGYTCLKNERPEDGISYSIRMGLSKIQNLDSYQNGDAVMFCVCDQPELTKETVEAFVRKYAESGKGIGFLEHAGVSGNPVIFCDRYWEELKELTGDQGGKIVKNRHPQDAMSFEVSRGRELRDIDYREDLEKLVVVRGGGDLATGTIHRLYLEGYRILILETKLPACIRRQVSFCEAVYEGETKVEGVTAVRAVNREEIELAWTDGKIPVVVDPEGNWIKKLKPEVVVDAILAKKNLGTTIDMAPLTIGLGPDFTAKKDVDVVIETMRGESLGKIYREGSAIPNTGIAGVIAGYSKERVIYAPATGRFEPAKAVGERVEQGEVIGWIVTEDGKKVEIPATILGYLRGMIKEGYPVKRGLKIMDIEPRLSDVTVCFRISDKAKCIADSVYRVIKEYEDCQIGRSYL